MIPDNERVAHVDDTLLPYPTVRHCNCEMLIVGERCESCLQYRHTLRTLVSRSQAQPSSSSRVKPSSHVNYRWLSDDEKKKRLQLLHQSARAANRKVKNLGERLKELSRTHGCTVEQSTHQDLKEIMRRSAQLIAEEHPNGSFARIFWQQQLKASSQCDARQMKWHPAMIKWCLYLRHRSSGAYETLRKSGCLHLPSQRTLRDYTHVAETKIGFSKEVDDMLIEHAGI